MRHVDDILNAVLRQRSTDLQDCTIRPRTIADLVVSIRMAYTPRRAARAVLSNVDINSRTRRDRERTLNKLRVYQLIDTRTGKRRARLAIACAFSAELEALELWILRSQRIIRICNRWSKPLEPYALSRVDNTQMWKTGKSHGNLNCSAKIWKNQRNNIKRRENLEKSGIKI